MKIKELVDGDDFELVLRPVKTSKKSKKEKSLYIPIHLFGNIKIIDKSDGRRIIAGYGNIAVVDSENQIIPTESLKGGLETLLKDPAYANLMIVHRNIQIGKIIEEYGELTTHVDEKGLFIVAELRSDIKTANNIWEQILDGKLNGFSIGCEVIDDHKECDLSGDNCVEVLDNINIFEVSVCIPPTQKIQCNPSEIEIKDINIGDLVLTHKGNYKSVIKKYVRKYDGKLITVKPRFTPDEFISTSNHPILVAEAGYCEKYKSWNESHRICSPNCDRDDCDIKPEIFNRKWIPAGKLSKENHLLAFPINKKILSDKEILNNWNDDWVSIRNHKNGGLKKNQLLDKNFWRLVGYWLAEGSINKYKNQNHIYFYPGKHEIDNISDIKKLISKTTNRKYYSRDTLSNAHSIDYCDKASYNFFNQFKSKPYKYGQKRIPRWVEDLPLEFQREMVIGYMLGDKFTSVSKQMLKSIQRILLRFGVLVSMSKSNKRGRSDILGRIINMQDSWRLNIEKISLRNLLGLDLIHSHKENHLEKWDDNYVYIPIGDISSSEYNGNVMNLEIDGDNSYGNSLIMTHNCSTPINEMSGFVVVSKSKYEKGDFMNKSDVCEECDIKEDTMVKKKVKTEETKEKQETKEESKDEKKTEEETTEEKTEVETLSNEERITNIERSISNMEAILSKLIPEEKSDDKKDDEEEKSDEDEDKEEKSETTEKKIETDAELVDPWKKSYDELKSVFENYLKDVSKSIEDLTSTLKSKEEKSEVDELKQSIKARDDTIAALEKKVDVLTKVDDEIEVEQKTVQDDKGDANLIDESPFVVERGTVTLRDF